MSVVSPLRSVFCAKRKQKLKSWGVDMVHIVDAHVGRRIRQRRWMIDMTQQVLADSVGIRFQQIQKYETGANRVSASRLWDIANTMDVPVGFFFHGVTRNGEERENLSNDLLAEVEVVELVGTYYAMPNNQRQRLIDLARALAGVS
jgi:transcriptional regulator with XRE-family HTH domain